MKKVNLNLSVLKIFNLLFVVFVCFSGCSESSCCTNINTTIYIKYVNDDNENILELPEGIDWSKIKIYHQAKDKTWVLFFEGQDNPDGSRITNNLIDGTYLEIIPSTTFVENNLSRTKIEFSKTSFDIITTEVEKQGNSYEMVTKVWYNDTLKWKRHSGERAFEVLKNNL